MKQVHAFSHILSSSSSASSCSSDSPSFCSPPDSHLCGSVALQLLQTRLPQVVPVPGVEGQQATQLLQRRHL